MKRLSGDPKSQTWQKQTYYIEVKSTREIIAMTCPGEVGVPEVVCDLVDESPKAHPSERESDSSNPSLSTPQPKHALTC